MFWGGGRDIETWRQRSRTTSSGHPVPALAQHYSSLDTYRPSRCLVAILTSAPPPVPIPHQPFPYISPHPMSAPSPSPSPLTSSPGLKFSWHRGHRFANFSDLAAEWI